MKAQHSLNPTRFPQNLRGKGKREMEREEEIERLYEGTECMVHRDRGRGGVYRWGKRRRGDGLETGTHCAKRKRDGTANVPYLLCEEQIFF